MTLNKSSWQIDCDCKLVIAQLLQLQPLSTHLETFISSLNNKQINSFMLATDPTVVLRIPVRNPTRSLFTSTSTSCFDSRGTRSRSRFSLGPTLSLNSIKMQLLRRTGCFNSPRLQVEAEIGGEDLFNAAATDKRTPNHLVIMVNGITGR